MIDNVMKQYVIRVIIVDDHDLVRKGLVGLLEGRGIKVVGEARLGVDAVRLASELKPDVVLMDLNMPGMSGVEATQRLSASAPQARVVVLTVFADDRHVMDAIRAGACGYLLKEAPPDQIAEAVRAAARGEGFIPPRIAGQLIRRVREPNAIEPGDAELTARELEVMDLLVQGMDNPHIAQTLHLSQHTVKNHVSNIFGKLQVANRIQAAVRAVRTGLV